MPPHTGSRLALRTVVLALALLCWPAFGSERYGRAEAQSPPPPETCVVTGTVKAGQVPLPGVSVSVVASGTNAAVATSTGPDGTYRLALASPGVYRLTLELPGFAPVVRDLDLPGAGCPSTIDATLVLTSRVPPSPPSPANPPAPTARAQAGGQVPGRALGDRAAGQRSRQGMPGVASATPEAGDQTADSATKLLLPPGFSPDAATESVVTSGNTGQMNEPLLFGNGPGGRLSPDGIGGPPGGPQQGGGPQIAQGGPGRGMFIGPGGAPGGPGGPGGFGPGGFGRGMLGANRVRLTAFYTLGGSPLDAAPYPLTSAAAQKPDYLSQRMGVVAGGPLGIPKLFDKNKTSFFFNYTGNHSSNAYDSYSTVPTLAERSGDLSAFSTQIFDPTTGQPFAGNQIPASRISPAAAALLTLFPAPNLPGTTQNYRYSTTSLTSQDDVNFRLIRNFGSTGTRPGGMFGFLRGGGRGGGTPSGVKNLSIGIHYHRLTTDTPNVFQTMSSTSQARAWDVPVTYAFSAWGMMNLARARYNRSESQTFGNFAFSQNVAGAAGIAGASQDPFDWSAPGVTLSSFTSLHGISPSDRLAQTIDVGDTMIKLKGRHAIHFGADYRAYFTDNRSDANAAGTFVFTGLYTGDPAAARPLAGSGLDFADFLLGMPQQASVQYGPGMERFRGRSWDLFLQDDWRVASKVTLNFGARYEFVSPFWEANNRMVTLDVNPTFTAAVPVVAGTVGPFSGQLPSTLVKPDYGDIAPRIGVAWRAQDKTVVRAGYGINYNAGVYSAIAQQLAAQPPFAVAATSFGTVLVPLSLTNALLLVSPTTTNNTFAIDPNYRLGYVQIWNVDVQRTLGRTMLVDVAYIGTRGANLDLQRAPNRGPDGLLIPNVVPFILETSQATSTMNAVSVRLQKRLSSGFSASAAYTYSRAFDDASTIGGGTAVVAQNDQDLAAEWGPSSFDQPHRFTGAASYQLPFGRSKRWLNGDGFAAGLFGGWQLAGNVSIASGLPFTARVLGALADVANGVNGTLRADYTGVPIALADPTVAEWFNTAAFIVPGAGQFGDAGRNSIRGPTTEDVDMSLAKDIPLGGDRGLNIRLQATNVLNTARFSVIDTVVNSPTFGRVIGVLPMRQMQIVMRFRF